MPHLTAVPDADDAAPEAWGHIARATARALAVPNLDAEDRADLIEIRRLVCEITGQRIVEDTDTSEAAAMLRVGECIRAELSSITSEHWHDTLKGTARRLTAAAELRGAS